MHKKFSILILILLFASLISSYGQWFPEWKEINYPLGYEPRSNADAYLDVFYLKSNPKLVWVCGYNARVLFSKDGGNTWEGRTLNRDNLQFESITFVTEKIGFVSGSNKIYRTIDGGDTWEDITPPYFANRSNVYWGNYFYDKENGILLGGHCDMQEFFTTSNGGDTWNYLRANVSESKLADALLLPDRNLYIAVGSGYIWESPNGRNNWRATKRTQRDSSDWQEELSINGNTILLPYSKGCQGTTSNLGGIRISTDMGNTWNDFYTGNAMFGTWLNSPTTGWAVGFNKSIYFTCDAGRNWKLLNCGVENADLDDIMFVDDTTGIVVGSKIYKLTNAVTKDVKIIADTIYLCPNESRQSKLDSISRIRTISYCGFATEQTGTTEGEYFSYKQSSNSCKIEEIRKTVFLSKPAYDYNILLIPQKQYYCEGDTVDIRIFGPYREIKWAVGDTTRAIKVSKSGTYRVTLKSPDNCTYVKEITLDFKPLPKVNLSQSSKDNCVNFPIILTNNTNIKGEWKMLGSTDILSTSNTLSVTKSGSYFMELENEYGCKNNSDTVQVNFRLDTNVFAFSNGFANEKNILNFDTILNTEEECRSLKIYNQTYRPTILDGIFLSRNVSFTSPKSQFPLLLNPKDSIEVKICFNPNKLGMDYDTIRLEDNCSPHSIYLKAMTKGAKFNGEGKCQVPWSLEVINLNKNPFVRYSNLNSNPTNQIAEFKVMTDCEKEIEIDMFNNLGENQDIKDIVNVIIEESNTVKTYTFTLDLSTFKVDTYYVKVKSCIESYFLPLLLIK